MSRTPDHITDRILDLLADRALGELHGEDAAELDRLLREHPGFNADTMDFAAAAAALSTCPPADDAPPPALRNRLLADASEVAARNNMKLGRAGAQPQTPRSATNAWLPWVLAAASIALAAIAWVNRPGATPPGTITVAQQLDDFEQHPPADLVRIAWAGQPDPLVTEGLSGEVLWSQTEQKGYMKFSGLRVNDPTVEQYQLWIFDGSREHPVDGGVFDIDDEGNAIIPIDAKLAVRQPTLFAVTVEKPGGVVVSSKERIAVVAPIGQG